MADEEDTETFLTKFGLEKDKNSIFVMTVFSNFHCFQN